MIAACAAIGFLLGSVPFGWILHRLVTGSDLRRQGSGNIGATNVARTLGLGPGLLVLGLDAGKGAAAVLAARALAPGGRDALLAGVGAVLGHVFSPWLGLHGGKGVATGLGAFALLAPRETLVAAVVFIVVVALSRHVSLGSIAAALSLPALLLAGSAADLTAGALVACGVIVWRHRQNLARLLAGTEPRLGGGRRSAP